MSDNMIHYGYRYIDTGLCGANKAVTTYELWKVNCPNCIEVYMAREVVDHVRFSRNELDVLAEYLGVCRGPGEPDYLFRRRIKNTVR